MVSALELLGLIIAVLLIVYSLISVVMTYIILKFPREPIDNPPDFGLVHDIKITTVNNMSIEAWIIYQEKYRHQFDEDPLHTDMRQTPTILVIHGTGRNRGRMTNRSQFLYELGYNVIIISVRDHGNSDSVRIGITITQFIEDIESVVNFWNAPILLYGHSISGGAILVVASKNKLVKGVISLNPPASFPHDLRYAMKMYGGRISLLLIPGITILLKILFRKYDPVYYQPIKACHKVEVPVLLFHGKEDRFYPYQTSELLHQQLSNSTLHILDGSGHSNLHKHEKYEMYLKQFLNDNKL